MVKVGFNILLLLFVGACTQQPVPIVFKGDETYSRNKALVSSSSTSSSYSSGYNPSYTSPVPENTEQSVAVESIGMSDLPPPTEIKSNQQTLGLSSNPAPISPPISSSPPPAVHKKGGEVILKPMVNPWTNMPRSENKPQPKIIENNKEVKIAAKQEHIEKAEKIDKKSESSKENNSSKFKWPLASKKITSSFGEKGEGKVNNGIYIAAGEGDPVRAIADGEVVYVNELKGYGNMILIKHFANKTSSYAHLSKAIVDKYKRVKQGDVIGYVGTTGNIESPHLFFSLYNGKTAIDPQKHLSSEMAGL